MCWNAGLLFVWFYRGVSVGRFDFGCLDWWIVQDWESVEKEICILVQLSYNSKSHSSEEVKQTGIAPLITCEYQLLFSWNLELDMDELYQGVMFVSVNKWKHNELHDLILQYWRIIHGNLKYYKCNLNGIKDMPRRLCHSFLGNHVYGSCSQSHRPYFAFECAIESVLFVALN